MPWTTTWWVGCKPNRASGTGRADERGNGPTAEARIGRKRISDSRLVIGWSGVGKTRQRWKALRCPGSSLIVLHNVPEGSSVVHRVALDHHHVFRARTSRRRSLCQAGRWPRSRPSLSCSRIPVAFDCSSSPAARPVCQHQAARPPGSPCPTKVAFRSCHCPLLRRRRAGEGLRPVQGWPKCH